MPHAKELQSRSSPALSQTQDSLLAHAVAISTSVALRVTS